MITQQKTVKMDDEQRAIYESIYGSHRHMPPNLRQVTEKEFLQNRPVSKYFNYEDFRSPYCCKWFKFGTEEEDLNFRKYAATFNIEGAKGYCIIYGCDKIDYYLFDAMEQWQQWFDSLGIIEDSGWSMDTITSSPMRGLKDYNRHVKFSKELSYHEMQYLRYYMQLIRCPGWTEINMLYNDRHKYYSFRTTYDSSD